MVVLHVPETFFSLIIKPMNESTNQLINQNQQNASKMDTQCKNDNTDKGFDNRA